MLATVASVRAPPAQINHAEATNASHVCIPTGEAFPGRAGLRSTLPRVIYFAPVPDVLRVSTSPASRRIVGFGEFEVDTEAHALRRRRLAFIETVPRIAEAPPGRADRPRRGYALSLRRPATWAG
jgi:hypothetical protein